MNCDRIQNLFADEWAGTLNTSDGELLGSHLAACASCREERERLSRLWQKLAAIRSVEPSAGVRNRFYAMLEGYQQGSALARNLPRRGYRLFDSLGLGFGGRPVLQYGLSALLLAAGFLFGYLLRSNRNGNEELANLREEVHEMRQMVTISLLKQQSASERLKGVSWSMQVSRPEPEFLSTLVHTLNSDSNVDVRLAAIDALSRFAGDAFVRAELVKSLPRQESPLVQISLIDLLVQLHERESIDVLRQLTNDNNLNEQVRNRARWGLQKLS